jgi:hypothetical protein
MAIHNSMARNKGIYDFVINQRMEELQIWVTHCPAQLGDELELIFIMKQQKNDSTGFVVGGKRSSEWWDLEDQGDLITSMSHPDLSFPDHLNLSGGLGQEVRLRFQGRADNPFQQVICP